MDMFLHVIKLEENMHHENLGYGAQLEGISQSHIFSILCRIRVAMSQHSMDYDTTYIKTVARKEVRDLTNDAVRSISDYIILRELKKILHHMEMEFSALKQNLSKTRRTWRNYDSDVMFNDIMKSLSSLGVKTTRSGLGESKKGLAAVKRHDVQSQEWQSNY